MKKTDIDTVTNVILNNEYKLHEDENEKIERITEQIQKRETKKPKHQKEKKKKTIKQKIFLVIKILIVLIILAIMFIYLFFKTSLFQKYKELWVVTAMSTMNHQYLATWFLSDEEIQEIMDKLEVKNNEDSNSNEIIIQVPIEEEKKEITVEKITGKNYVG